MLALAVLFRRLFPVPVSQRVIPISSLLDLREHVPDPTQLCTSRVSFLVDFFWVFSFLLFRFFSFFSIQVTFLLLAVLFKERSELEQVQDLNFFCLLVFASVLGLLFLCYSLAPSAVWSGCLEGIFLGSVCWSWASRMVGQPDVPSQAAGKALAFWVMCNCPIVLNGY